MKAGLLNRTLFPVESGANSEVVEKGGHGCGWEPLGAQPLFCLPDPGYPCLAAHGRTVSD